MWKDIKGYEGVYEISKSGVVRDKRSKHILSSFENCGYLRVNFFNHKKPYVHVLVALTYLPNPSNLPEVNHKNNKRDDNRLANLEWVSHSDNIKQVWETGGFKKRRRK